MPGTSQVASSNQALPSCIKCGAVLPSGALFCPACGKKQTPQQGCGHRVRGNGFGCAYRRPGERLWRANITVGYKLVDGKKRRVRREKGGFRTKRDALLYLDKLRDEKHRTEPTLLQLWEQYSGSPLEKLSDNKQVAYKIAWKRLSALQWSQISDITTKDLQDTVNDQAKTYYTAKDMRDLLSHLYQIAIADRFVPANLSKCLTLPDLEETTPNPFTADEQKALWADYAAGNIYTGYILLMIYTGMMPGELLGCPKDAIDWDNAQIFGAGRKTKKRKQTPIPLADVILPVLEHLCEESHGKKVVTMNKDNFYKEFHATIERLGLRKDLKPYSCRHTTATALVAADIAPSIVQEIMRHSKFSSTQRYIHISDEQTHEAINLIKISRVSQLGVVSGE